VIRRILGVLGTQLTAQVLAALVGIATTRLLGPEQRGWYAVATILPLFVVSASDFGLRAVLLYHLPRCGRDPRRVGEVLSAALRYVPVTLALVGALYVAIHLLAPRLSGQPPAADLVLHSAWLAVAFYLLGLTTVVLEGLEDFGTRNALALIAPLLSAVTCAGVVLAHARLSALRLLDVQVVAAALAAAASVAVIALRHRPRLTRVLPATFRREYLRFGLVSAPGMFALHVNQRFDALVLQALRGARETGLYAVATSFSELPVQALTAAVTVLFPTLGSAAAAARRDVTVRTAGFLGWLGLLSSAALCALAYVFVPLLYGREFQGAVTAAAILSLGLVGLAMTRVLTTASTALGHPRHRTVVALVGLVVTVALDLLWIPRHGAAGAAWASAIAYSLTGVLALRFLARALGEPVGRLAADIARAPLDAWQRRRGATAVKSAPVFHP